MNWPYWAVKIKVEKYKVNNFNLLGSSFVVVDKAKYIRYTKRIKLDKYILLIRLLRNIAIKSIKIII